MHKLCPTLIDCIYTYHFTKYLSFFTFFFIFFVRFKPFAFIIFFKQFFFDLVVQPAVPSIAHKWIPVTRAVYSWTAGGAKGKLCRVAGCWKKNHSVEEVVGKRMSVYPFWFAVPKRKKKEEGKKKQSYVPGNFLLSSRSLLETGAAEPAQTVSR